MPSKLVPVMETCLRTVQQNEVGEIDFYMMWEASLLPPEIFRSMSLQVLKAANRSFTCKLIIGTNDIKCRNLKKLELEGIAIDSTTFHNLTHFCPLIEELSLNDFGWSQVHVCNLSKLRVLNLKCCGAEWVKVDAPNLQSFIFRGMGVLHIGVSGNLKVLSISMAPIVGEQLQHIFSTNPYLEDLSLFDCTKLEEMNCSSPFLKYLSLSRCEKVVKAIVDAPNLRLLKWHHLPRSTLPITTPAPNGESKVSMSCGGEVSESWFQELRVFLTKFQKSDVEITSCRKIVFESERFRPTPVPSGHKVEKLTLSYEQSINLAHLNALFSVCHPTTVLCQYVDTKFNNASINSFCKELKNWKKSKCCNLDQIKCWRHFIKDAKFHFEADDGSRYGWFLKKRVSFAFEWEYGDCCLAVDNRTMLSSLYMGFFG